MRNFYFISGSIFVIWITFFDANNLINQFKLSSQLSDLENEKFYYMDRILEIQQEQSALTNDRENLERFAREHYLMKKPNEDIYIIPSD
jgi:cell division protein FtsB